MTTNSTVRPTISVDLKKYRIRIHKRTLHLIGNPDNILLLVNPAERTLAILRSDRSDPRAHHISWASLVNKNSFELYSRALVQNLHDVCSDWQANQSYRLFGEIIPNEGVVQFRMADYKLLNGAQS